MFQILAVTPERSAPVGVAPVPNGGDPDDPCCAVDEIEDPIGASPRRPRWSERGLQRLAHPLRVVQKRSGDEGKGGARDLCRQGLGQRSGCRTGDLEAVTLLAHSDGGNRPAARMAWPRPSASRLSPASRAAVPSI